MGGDAVEISGKEDEEEAVMDTPERSKNCQIATSITKFEESPVFNFLNSLSPIRSVKSTHISQSINPLTFASLPSVFTSPHVRESRFIRRHQLSDPSKPEFSSGYQTAFDVKNVNAVVENEKSNEQKENVDPMESDEGDPSYDCSKFVVDYSPDSGIKAKGMVDYGCNSLSDENMEVVSHADQNKEGPSCDWENMMDASDLFIFESPVVEGSDPEKVCTQPGDGNEATDNADMCDVITGENMDYEHLSGLYRGMRRRCLVFEMGGPHRNHLDENPTSDSSALLQSDNNNSNSAVTARNESSRCNLPGIGLHLNALATTPEDFKSAGQDSSIASRRLLTGPISSVDFHPSNASQNESLHDVASSLDREMDSVENAIVPVEDTGQMSGDVASEEINPSSPKKKRRRVEQAGDGDSCKRCNCKKSKCLKLYCECFAAGVYCVEPCACIDCFNKPIHEDTVLQTRKQIESRNPLAFAPKVIRAPNSIKVIRDDPSKTPASARHKRGCNCKKSGCLKKYCECYQGGVGCSINCRCEGCKNAFGRKDGSGSIGIEVEVEENEMDITEKSTLDRNFQKCAIENEHETTLDSSELPATPLHASRQLVQHPFSSMKKPPRSSFHSISSVSGSQSRQSFGKVSFLPPPPKSDEKQFETVIEEDEMPVFLQGGGGESSSPAGGIKLSSPNRKRVSPPRSAEIPAGLRSSRKLILRSIPSFPSLTSNQ